VALDADTKLVPAYLVGKRTKENTELFIDDLYSRLDSRVQLSTDKFTIYRDAVWKAFSPNVDYGQIVKSYEAEPIGPGRYSPPHVISVDKKNIWGKPNPKYISTSYVERQNLTMRMCIRRLTRLTNAFSKKVGNLEAAVSLWFAYYNFVRPHRSLNTVPAVKAGVINWRWKLNQLLDYTLAKS
jgi:IS1 family transposase